jgi:phenylalanyl-tRNA synthetase alpha chain
MDIRCDRSGGRLVFNTGDDWLEILGCGMVHPNVLRNCGLDPDEWQGFAFGMGVDRLAMLKYGVPDLRPMFEADTRWLAHYGFSAFAAPNPASGLS